MKCQIRFFAIVMLTVVALTASAFTALAAASNLHRASVNLAAPANSDPDAPNAACTKMSATADVYWALLNEDDEIALPEDAPQGLESYPSGTNLIVPVFEYDCVPKKAAIVSVFTLDGETVYTDKESLKASESEGFYAYPLGTTDGSPMDEGEWGVEYYNNKTLLTSGSIPVGGDEPLDTVTVIGTVTDAKTKKPIKGAVILVLVEGVTVQDFIDGDQQEEDIFTGAKTNNKGQFELESPLTREVEYSVIVVAKGYKPIGQDGLVIPTDAEDPVELPITMVKSK
ncbi:MAG TPA: carboxypeptidase-like regulatory domain-containing protein [Anaerolineae bacterium]